VRFAQVAPRLYRGGQPDEEDLRRLHELGVRTIISLRGPSKAQAAEEALAGELGMRFRRFAFSGLSEPEPAMLHQIVGAMSDPDGGAVYVHCHRGRDRTSLVTALYRVWVDHWAPELAWQKEAVDYGHAPWRLFFYKLDRAFSRLTAVPAAG
jgi:protein tyrosine/serine phosphatase